MVLENITWKLPKTDALRLAAMMGVDEKRIVVRETRTDIPAPICESCGRQIGLLDVANNAIDGTVHNEKFLEGFFCTEDITAIATDEELKRVSEVEHNINCIDCGLKQKSKPKWNFIFWK
jgi:hypothetical protein